MDYTNLKSKTIYDFCNDEQMINKLVIMSKEDLFRELNANPVLNALILSEFAEMTDNKELMQAVNEQYKVELQKENNEFVAFLDD
ncbi:MAG: hypothetical protein E7065_00290 [Lentimicrobiaceae bacterium]|nr:hypothetical protein [Lentimicrobiaceae bacterium]MBQ2906891.1 hypothetical protein [Bacteroidales bacterium]